LDSKMKLSIISDLQSYSGGSVRRFLIGVTVCIVLGFPPVAVTAMVSTVTATATPVTPIYGQVVVLTASVGPAPPPAGVAAPAGQVTFQDGGSPIGTGTVASGIATLRLSILAAGAHTITAVYGGDSNWSSSQASITVTVSPATTITTVSLTDKYAMVAVVIPVSPGVGTPTGSVQFLDPRPNVGLIGKATLVGGSGSAPWPYTNVKGNGILRSPSTAVTAAYSGDSNFKASTSAPLLQVTSAAANLGISFAPDEAISLFNVVGLSGDTPATLPLTTSLGGATVKITDSAGTSRMAPLYGVFASTSQINLVIPADTAADTATVTVTLPGGIALSTIVTITPTTPSIFTANMNGQGVFAGQVVHVHADGSQTVESSATFDPATKAFVPTSIAFGPATDQVFLVLYGTGIRHSPPGVFALVNNLDAPMLFSAQGQYPGLDQINLQIPGGLAAGGTVDVVIYSVGPLGGGIPANKVTVTFQ
jgi:uncharacterized protein (TIGR03437 family)